MADAGTLVSGTKLGKMRDDVWTREALIDRKAAYDLERLEDARRFRRHLNRIIGLSVVSFCVYAYLKIASLARVYPTAYAWWKDTSDAKSAHPQITVPHVALRVEFPAAYWVQTLRFASETIPLAGAQFLLEMASAHSTYLTRVHWNGTADALRYADRAQFLPIDAMRDGTVNWEYVWHAWAAKNDEGELVNPFAGVLFANVDSLIDSPAIKAYYADPPDRGYIDALYYGGLVEVAMRYGTTKKTGADMVHHLMGSHSSFAPSCDDNRFQRGLQTSMQYGMFAGMFAGVGGHIGTGTKMAKSLPMLITLSGFGVGASVGASSKC